MSLTRVFLIEAPANTLDVFSQNSAIELARLVTPSQILQPLLINSATAAAGDVTNQKGLQLTYAIYHGLLLSTVAMDEERLEKEFSSSKTKSAGILQARAYARKYQVSAKDFENSTLLQTALHFAQTALRYGYLDIYDYMESTYLTNTKYIKFNTTELNRGRLWMSVEFTTNSEDLVESMSGLFVGDLATEILKKNNGEGVVKVHTAELRNGGSYCNQYRIHGSQPEVESVRGISDMHWYNVVGFKADELYRDPN